MADRTIVTADNLRDSGFGVGSVQKITGQKKIHEGGLTRAVENQYDRRESRNNEKDEALNPTPKLGRSVVVSSDGSEILTIINGEVVKREKRVPPNQR